MISFRKAVQLVEREPYSRASERERSQREITHEEAVWREEHSAGFPGPVRDAISDLYDLGYPVVEQLDITDPVHIQILATFVNSLAKSRYELYEYKPYLVAHALAVGAEGGWGEDEGGDPVFYLYTSEGGVTSYHDPSDELYSLIGDFGEWEHEWRGTSLQKNAGALLQRLITSRGGALRDYRQASTPVALGGTEES